MICFCSNSKAISGFVTGLTIGTIFILGSMFWGTSGVSNMSWGQVVDPLLARPEWQLRADLEFDVACQDAVSKLCREVLKSIQSDPSNTQNKELLGNTVALLEIQHNELPKILPDHTASVTYLEDRKRAASDWYKTYKSRGRDLPKATVEREMQFQESQKLGLSKLNTANPDASKSLGDGITGRTSSSEPGMVANEDISVLPAVTVDDESTDLTADVVGRDSSTIKSIIATVKAIDEYRTRQIPGSTTAEKQVAVANESKALKAFIEKQPDWFLTYAIRDVSLGEKSIKLEVDDPIELQLLNQEFSNSFVMKSLRNSFELNDPTLFRKWRSIRPGQLLRIRVKAGGAIERSSKPSVGVGTYQLMGVCDKSSSDRSGETIFTLLAGQLIDAKILRAPQNSTTGPP